MRGAWLKAFLAAGIERTEYWVGEHMKGLSKGERRAARKDRYRSLQENRPLIDKIVRHALGGQDVDPYDVLVLDEAGLLWQATRFRAGHFEESSYLCFAVMRNGKLHRGYLGFDADLNLVSKDVRFPEAEAFMWCLGEEKIPMSQEAVVARAIAAAKTANEETRAANTFAA